MKPVPLQNLDAEGRRLMARAAENAGRNPYETVYSDFLTPREQRLYYAAVASEGHGDRLFFWGGALSAERRCAVLVPDWLLSDVPAGVDPFGAEREAFLLRLGEESVIDLTEITAPVSLRASSYAALTHRDWLGSILALGVERHVLGDIAVLDPGRAIAFFTPRIVSYIADNLSRAGNDAVHAEAAELPAGFEIPHSFERLEMSVASPRLDGIVRALTSLSRDDAAALVRTGDVELNYFPEQRTDAPVDPGDTLSIRGFGKYIIDDACGITRHGRNRLRVRKYV